MAAQAQKPQVDTQPWKSDLRKLQAKIKKLVRLIEDEENQELCVAHDARAKELQREAIALQAKIREVEGAVRKQAKPLPTAKAREYLDRLRESLNADIPVAAEAIRAITGPITIRQEMIPGRPGARWIATFSPDLFRAVRVLADGKLGSPTTSDINPVQHPVVEIALEKVPKYELMAPLFKQLRENGASVESIASAHGVTWQFANEVLKFAETGQRPKWKCGKPTGTGNRVKYLEIVPQVVELSKQKMPFARIAARLGVSESTVRRAYDHAHPDAVRKAAQHGQRPRRATYSHLGEDVYKQIRKLLRAGKKQAEVARKVGCSTATVYRVKQQLDRGDNEAA